MRNLALATPITKWTSQRLKWSLAALESGSRESGGGNTLDDGVFSIGGEHIGWNGEFYSEPAKYISDSYFASMRRGRVKPNDVLLVKDGATIGKLCHITDVPFGRAAVNEHVYILRTNHETDSRFLFYFLQSMVGQQAIQLYVRGSAQPGLSSEFVSRTEWSCPPLDEQRAIAAFLDRETARIDELIAKKQRLIELLKEKRQAVISRAVTKGLNPDAPMKPSSIDWLGDVPKHWLFQPLKYVTLKIGSGKTPKGGAEVYVSSGVMLLRSQNVHDEGMRLDDVVFIDDETDTEMATTRVKPGDVLLNITGASIGRCSIASHDLPKANVNQHVCIIRPKTVKAEFVHAILCSKGVKDWIQSQENGTSREGLNFRQVGNLRILIPPQGEQRQIVSSLRSTTSELDKLICRVLEAIDLLKEYRTALIAAAVTGQIDVRQEVH